MEINQQEQQAAPQQQPPRTTLDVTKAIETGGKALQGGLDFIQKHGQVIELTHGILRSGAKILYKTVVGSYNAVRDGIEEGRKDIAPKE